MLAQALVIIETKTIRGRVPSWTIFPVLDEVTRAKYNRSIDLYSLAIVQNIQSIYGYYFCNILLMLAQALVMVETKLIRGRGRVPSWTIFPVLNEILITHSDSDRKDRHAFFQYTSISLCSICVLEYRDMLKMIALHMH
jgi:hypothetical protein